MNNFASPPALETVARTAQIQRAIAASTLRNSASLRTLMEVVRSDVDLFPKVANFTSRREEFKKDYDLPGRNLAPYFAGISRHEPHMLDMALGQHFESTSSTVRSRLEEDAKEQGYSYWPKLVIGSGPQSQILVSGLIAEGNNRPGDVLVIDNKSTVGGTFSSEDGMNFRLNSRTRKQTEKDPKPGTDSNLNTLKPGIVALPDLTTDTYAPAGELGRTVRINHALNGNDTCVNMELLKVVPDTYGASTVLPGNVTAIVKNKLTGMEYSVRTDAIVLTTGLGEIDLSGFDKSTRESVASQAEQLQEGKMPKVMTYTDFYEWMSNNPFPLKDIKKVAVVGAGDSARTTIGTLLGYEPRDDDSVLQLDTVENVDWYGQKSANDRDFVERTRLRYAQLGLELPRLGNDGRVQNRRASRIRSTDSKVSKLFLTDEGKVTVNGGDNRYDLVVLANGFGNNTEDWLKSNTVEPVLVTDYTVIDKLKTDQPIEAGTVIKFPEGKNIDLLQVMTRNDLDGTYDVRFIFADGTEQLSRLSTLPGTDRSSLLDYLDIDNTSAGDDKSAQEVKNEVNATPYEFIEGLRNLTAQEKAKVLIEAEYVVLDNRSSAGTYRIGQDFTEGRFLNATLLEFNTATQSYTPRSGSVNLDLTDNSISAAKINTEFLFGAITEGEMRQVTVGNLSNDQIEELIRAEAFFINLDALSPGLVFRKNYEKEDENYDYIGGTIQQRYQGTDSIASLANELKDKRYVARFKSSTTPIIKSPVSKTTPKRVVNINTLYDTNGNAYAGLLDVAPVYIVGPAAKLPINSGVTEFIPQIPENTVAIFASQPKVTDLASRLKTNRLKSRRVVSAKEAATTKVFIKPKIQFNETRETIFLGIGNLADVETTNSMKKMSATDLLKFGIGVRAKELGFVTAKGNDPHNFTALITRDKAGSFTEFRVEVPGYDQALDTSQIGSLLGGSLTTQALRRILNAGGNRQVELDITIDERGLRVGDLGVIVRNKPKPAPKPVFAPNTVSEEIDVSNEGRIGSFAVREFMGGYKERLNKIESDYSPISTYEVYTNNGADFRKIGFKKNINKNL